VEERISLVTLGVADVARARKFYEALGWQTNAVPDDDVVFFQSGGMILALWGRDQLAEDSGVEDAGGWGGVTLAHNVALARRGRRRSPRGGARRGQDPPRWRDFLAQVAAFFA
jgi:catechol 2,3-dioxygenase-like lactoylglutathione lyase family enzyme